VEIQGESHMRLIGVRRLVEDGNHNAFTDLTRFKDQYYLTFRSCPDGHMIFPSSSIIIMRSLDGRDWERVHQFNVEGRDVRDPHFLNTGEKLFVYSGAWPVTQGDSRAKDYADLRSYFCYSLDGTDWSGTIEIEGGKGYYCWRTARFEDTYYLCGKRYWESLGFDLSRDPDGRQSVLLESRDAVHWREAALFLDKFGDETAFAFDSSGNLTAIVRTVGRRGAYLCRSQPPYNHWRRVELANNIGGPLLVEINDRYLVGGRLATDEGPRTTLFWLEGDELQPCLTLPSGGDNSYPGFVELKPGKGLLSYYSTHEGQTNVYLAELEYSVQ